MGFFRSERNWGTTHHVRISALTALLFAGLWGTGCGNGSGDGELDGCSGSGCACSADSDCSQGRYCASGSCVSDCDSGRSCPSAQCDPFGRCIAVVVGGGTGGGVGNPNYDGGIVDLDPETAAALDADACAGWSAEPEPENAILMLVVDTSGSMDVAPEGQGRETKWEITEAALRTAIADLPPSTAVGVLFYPGRERVSESSQPRDPSTCVDFDNALPIDLLGGDGSSQRAAIDDALAAIGPQGGTPTHDAYEYGLEQLKNSPVFGTKNMLLITDGQPTFSKNCVGSGLVSDPVEEAPIVEAVRTAHQSDGIRTFVIGAPGSELSWTGDAGVPGEDTRPWLSEAAEVGGTAIEPCSHSGEPYCHFDMSVQASFAEGLRTALAAVSSSIVPCSYALPAPPAGQSLDSGAVNVVLTTSAGDNKLILRDDGADCTEGWRYTDDGGVELCPASCDRAHSDAGAKLELLFGCATLDEPPK